MNRVSKLILLITVILSSCENSNENKKIAQLIGGTLGAIVGSEFGSGAGKTISTILGSTTGYLIGTKLVNTLSDKEKKQLTNLTEKSLELNKKNEKLFWKSDEKNISAEIEPLEKFTINSYKCRKYKKTINNNEKIETVESKACRDEDGNWQILNN